MPTNKRAETVGGIAIICGVASGFASLIAAIFAFFDLNWVGTGVCLGSAGLAFGLVANAVWRN